MNPLFSFISGIFNFFRVRPISFGPLGYVELAPIHIVAMVVLFGLVTFYLYVNGELSALKAKEEESYTKHFARLQSNKPKKNERWEKVSQLIASQNPADWRVALIEADSMMDHMLTLLGYPGSTVGEKLSNTTAMQFPALEYAWEAHKMRNKIAHEGMNYNLDYREALHTYRCFEKVFTDARYI